MEDVATLEIINEIKKVAKELSDLSHNLFKPFPRGSAECIFCPAFSYDPFVKRWIWRSMLVLYRMGQITSRWWLWVAMLIPAGLIGLLIESCIQIIISIGEHMKSLLSFLCVVALIALPAVLILQQPQSYNVVAQILFSVLLFGVSTWFGYSINYEKARKEATAMWVPAAEVSCKQLLTISATAERMKRTQASACQNIEPFLQGVDPKQVAPVRSLVKIQCEETAEKLASLRDHVENAISHWQVFIGCNCEGSECAAIEQRIDACRKGLFGGFELATCENVQPNSTTAVS